MPAAPINPPPEVSRPRVYVSLGANLADPVFQVREGLRRLRDLAGAEFRASSLWASTPVDCPRDSPRFVNAACVFVPRPGETPESLLLRLQDLERAAGRRPKRVMNEPRPLDLDLIGFGTEIRTTPFLVLPHPRAAERRFVLAPLAEIDPDLRLPGWGVGASTLLEQLESPEILERIGAADPIP